MVYSGHLRPIAALRNWGYDFPAARDLLARIGISISARSASKCVRWLPLPPRAHGIVAAAGRVRFAAPQSGSKPLGPVFHTNLANPKGSLVRLDTSLERMLGWRLT